MLRRVAIFTDSHQESQMKEVRRVVVVVASKGHLEPTNTSMSDSKTFEMRTELISPNFNFKRRFTYPALNELIE